jgi:hypothetical protein
MEVLISARLPPCQLVCVDLKRDGSQWYLVPEIRRDPVRSILAITMSLTASPGWAFCNPATPQSYEAFMDCLDTEREARDALDAYRSETDRRFKALEREQHYQEELEQQARQEQDLRELERRNEQMEREQRYQEELEQQARQEQDLRELERRNEQMERELRLK